MPYKDPEKRKEWKKKHPEIEQRYKKKKWKKNKNNPIEQQKAKARRKANYKIKIDKCEVCGAKAMERHHPDYRFPLWVIPVCRDCHRKFHSIPCLL